MTRITRFIGTNYPLEDILAFRESGYTDQLLAVLAASLDDTWDLYLYFELSRWKGNDLAIEPSPRRKLVLCIGDESTRTNYSFLNQVDVVFRMYMSENQRDNIFHVPVGTSRYFTPPATMQPFAERPRNVFFSGNLHRGRAGLYQALTGLPPLPFAVLHRLRRVLGEQFNDAFPHSTIHFSTGFHSGSTPEQYGRNLANSKIVLCPAGIENPESMRHFEAASLGCVILSGPMPNVAVYSHAPFVTLASWRELKPTVDRLLREPNRLLDLHAQTLDWWHHTACATAAVQQMQRQLSKLLVASQG